MDLRDETNNISEEGMVLRKKLMEDFWKISSRLGSNGIKVYLFKIVSFFGEREKKNKWN